MCLQAIIKPQPWPCPLKRSCSEPASDGTAQVNDESSQPAKRSRAAAPQVDLGILLLPHRLDKCYVLWANPRVLAFGHALTRMLALKRPQQLAIATPG